MSRFEAELFVELHSATGDNVLGGCGIADYLGIAVELHVGLLAVAIEDGEYCFALILACYDINAVEGDKLCLFALDDDIVALTPVEQAAEPVEHGILCLGASLTGKAVLGVAGESTGEVFAHVAVGDVLCTVHQHLCSIV